MKAKQQTRKARIELIPLMDMIFLVLLSFVYTFLSMSMQKGIPVKLPHAKTAVQDKTDFLVVTVTTDRELYVNKKKVSPRDLTKELLIHKNNNPNTKVFLNADKSVIYEYVIDVIDSIRKSGIEKVFLETADNDEQ